jgi:DNA-binding PadR family transcriptional regulator
VVADPVQLSRQELHGYQLGVVREVLLALLARDASHGYELRARLALALGPLADALNEGQVYVTLGRLERAGLVSSRRVDRVDRRDRRVYELTEAGRERVLEWLEDTSWPKPAPAEFHLKLVAAAAAGLADPVGIVDRQRRELLSGVREALEGVVLRLQADLRWLEACARFWSSAGGGSWR